MSDRYVREEDVLKTLSTFSTTYGKNFFETLFAKLVPTADVEPVRHSKFQGDYIPVIYGTRVCFSCKHRVPVDNICICCGAKMDGKEDSV